MLKLSELDGLPMRTSDPAPSHRICVLNEARSDCIRSERPLPYTLIRSPLGCAIFIAGRCFSGLRRDTIDTSALAG
jgi:hypothetical protein